MVIRIDNAINFGTVNHVRELFQRLRDHYCGLRHLLWFTQGVAQVDVAGVQLKERLSVEFCHRWINRSAPTVLKEYFQSVLLSL